MSISVKSAQCNDRQVILSATFQGQNYATVVDREQILSMKNTRFPQEIDKFTFAEDENLLYVPLLNYDGNSWNVVKMQPTADDEILQARFRGPAEKIDEIKRKMPARAKDEWFYFSISLKDEAKKWVLPSMFFASSFLTLYCIMGIFVARYKR